MSPGCLSQMNLRRAFSLLSESQPLYLVRIMPMVHHIWPNAQDCGEKANNVQFAGADIGEIMTDTAEGNLDEKCLMSVSYDGTLVNAAR